MSFTYNGAMGNFNNFKTSSECEMFCAKLQCTFGGEFVAVLLSTLITIYLTGTPLKVGASNQRCTSNSGSIFAPLH